MVHSAIVLNDNSVANMDAERFGTTLSAKVDTCVRMVQAFADEPLDFVLFFSSLQSFAKAAGQSNYAAGCTFEDAFALRLDAVLPCAVKVMNWGYWGSVGVATDDSYRQRMAQVGIGSIEPDEGMAVLSQLMSANHPQAGLIKQSPNMAEVAAQQQKQQPKPAAKPAPSTGEVGSLHGKIDSYIKSVLTAFLNIAPEHIDSEELLSNYGVDSIIGLEIISEMGKHFSGLSKTLLFEYQTVNEVCEFLIEKYPAELGSLLDESIGDAAVTTIEVVKPAAAKTSRRKARFAPAAQAEPAKQDSDKIAIIGLTGRYPKAGDLDAFWQNLSKAEDCITEVPVERWDHEPYYSADPTEPNKSHCKWGGFLDDVDGFDALLFNISPADSAIMSNKDCLFMETVWTLFESAGITRQTIAKHYDKQVGLYVGAMYVDIPDLSQGPQQASMSLLNSYNSIANRTSQFFGLQGPSIAIDTACSSALNGIHMACKDLRAGECRLAVAGGVNYHSDPVKFVNLSTVGLLSSNGDKRAFSGGDGYLPAEGVGAVLLKRLDDAIEDNDNIMAVVLSTATNHNGSATSYMVPNVNTQAELIQTNIDRAGISPDTISYIETSATGVMLGDTIELSTLNRVFGKVFTEGQSCPIGSVKSNIGHAEAASGMSQLSKVILQLQRKQLLPNIGLDEVSDELDLSAKPFYLQSELADWFVPDGQPRRALVNSFGATGSNASIILEEYRADVPAQPDEDTEQLFVLSARSEKALKQQANNLIDHLAGFPEIRLSSLSYTLQSGREALTLRLAVVATSSAELAEKLKAWAGRTDNAKLPEQVYEGDTEQRTARDNSSEAAVETLLAGRQLGKIAELWVSGGKVPWDQLYQHKPSMVSGLPGYPFERYGQAKADPAVAGLDSSTINWLSLGSAGDRTKDITEDIQASHPAANPQSSIADEIEQHLNQALGLPDDTIKHSVPLVKYGVNSISGARLVRFLAERFKVAVSTKDFVENDTVAALAGLIAERGGEAPVEAPPTAPQIPKAEEAVNVSAEQPDSPAPEADPMADLMAMDLDKFKNGEMDLDDIKKILEGEI